MCIAVPNVGVAGFINGKLFCFINLFYNLPIFWNYVGIQIRTSTILSDVINSIDDNRKQWLLKDAVDSYQGRASETYSCAADKKSMKLIKSFYFLCKKLWVFSQGPIPDATGGESARARELQGAQSGAARTTPCSRDSAMPHRAANIKSSCVLRHRGSTHGLILSTVWFYHSPSQLA